jgi:hypothetical protein
MPVMQEGTVRAVYMIKAPGARSWRNRIATIRRCRDVGLYAALETDALVISSISNAHNAPRETFTLG